MALGFSRARKSRSGEHSITQKGLGPRLYELMVEAVDPKVWRIASAIGLHVIIWLWSSRMQLARNG